MEEVSKVVMIERVSVAKFDKTFEDDPKEPIDVVVQETRTEVSLADAILMGWQPKEADVEATATVKLNGIDGGGAVGD